MERNMMWGALGLGCIGWLAALLVTTSRRPPASDHFGASSPVGASSPENPLRVSTVSRPFWWLALLLPVGVWAATLPTTPPFSSGQGWGRGFLLGGAASLLGAVVVLRAASRPDAPLRVAATAPLFAAIICVCVPLLWMRASIIDALAGVALGWVAVAAVLLLGVLAENEESSTARQTSVVLLGGGAFATTLCGVAALGVYRDFSVADVARGTYPAVAVVLAASVALALLSGALLQEIASSAAPLRPRMARAFDGLNVVFCLLLPLGIAILLGTRILDDLALVYVVGAGSMLGLLLWWLAWDDASRESKNGESGIRSGIAAAVLVALCGFMLAFQIMQGFGVGLMLLAAWPASILALPDSNSFPIEPQSEADLSRAARFEAAQTVSLLLSFVAILLLSRLFATRFRADLRGASLDDHFALFGLVGGAVAPVFLASLWFGARERGAAASLPRLLGVGALAVALLGAMLTLWGAKVVPAHFAGLALACAGFAAGFAPRIHSGAVAMLSLALGLMLAQWTHHFAPFAELSRAQRLQFLGWGVGATVLLILIVEIAARLASGARGRKTNLAAPTQGAS